MKKMLATLLAAGLTLSLVACGSNQSSGTKATTAGSGEAASNATTESGVKVAGDALVLRVANVTSDNAKDAGRHWKTNLEKVSGGKMSLDLYEDNSLGDDSTTFQMAQQGDCDIAIGSTSSVASIYHDYYIYDTPYLFLNKDEVYNIGFGGETGQKIISGVDSIGLHGLGMWENGFRELTTNDRDVKTVADLKGLKIRTMPNDIHIAAWTAMGANPTPMTFSEVYTGLQQGTIDGEENTIGIILGNNFQEVEKYIIYTDHVYTPYYVVMNKNTYSNLTDEQKGWLEDTFKEATQFEYDDSSKIEKDADKTFEDAGCTVTHLDEKAKQGFADAAASANSLEAAAKSMEHPEYAQAMQSELDTFRK